MIADRILEFLLHLKIDHGIPPAVEVLNPYTDPATFQLCRQFYHRYYPDDRPRYLIVGINPGRHGGGLTGIPFTDPVKLEVECGIKNELSKKAELSADFIHMVIHAMGGLKSFYEHFYFSSVSPLGFTKDGKNFNYYDIPALQEALMPFITTSMESQLKYPLNRDLCFCLGEGDNYKFFSRLNEKHHYFRQIIPLAHPRFIMQYKRKKVHEYVAQYCAKLGTAI